MNAEKVINAINVMNDSFRAIAHVDDDPILVRQFCLVYDELYGAAIASLSHPDMPLVHEALPPMWLCRECKRN